MKSGSGFMCLIIAVIFLGVGFYLLPASMWRNISVAALAIGTVLLIVGIWLIRKSRK